MAIYNVIIIVFMIYYTFFFANLVFRKKREVIQTTNKKLDEMRKVGRKTLEQQKEFINTKYPKKSKFIFTWKWLGKLILMILISILLYRAYNLIFKILEVEFNLWQVILIIILFPILSNMILRIFHLENDDLLVYLK